MTEKRGGLPAVVGYFTEWGMAVHGYRVQHIVRSGSADRLSVINYAFAGIGDDLRCRILDPQAAFGRRFTADESVDGVADPDSGAVLRGHFNQLRKLKVMYPHLKVLMSIGGWGESYNFSDASLPENRPAFVQSCVDMFIKGRFAPGIVAPGVFDGIDIDWEYPAAPGKEGNVYRPQDREHFTALLADLRAQLDAVAPGLLLTVATPGGRAQYTKMDLAAIHPSLDWINLMTYDYYRMGQTGHNAPLYALPHSPAGDASSDRTVRGYLAAGVPAGKLYLGVPFYGRGWSGVPDVDHGLHQPASGLAEGKFEKGYENYRYIQELGYPVFWDPVAQVPWMYNGCDFWTLDDPRALRAKMAYVKQMGLGGAMFWELSGDDDQGTLIAALTEGLA